MKTIRKSGKIKVLTAVTLILLMTMSAFAFTPPPVKAQASSSSATIYMFITATNAGLGQNMQVVVFMSSVTPDAVENTGSRWQDITVNITRPDGTTDSKYFASLDAVASDFFYYNASMVGTYSFQGSFPGQTIQPFYNVMTTMSSLVPIVYGPAKSAVVTVNVTTTLAPAPVSIPFPTAYWTRPISAINNNWWSISSNWLLPGWDTMMRQFDQGSAYDRYTTAPNSAHILWTSPLTFGGLIGGEFAGAAFYNGMSYEQYFKPPVIIDGRIYYNTIVANEPTAEGTFGGVNGYTTVTQESQSSITCKSLETGQTIMTIPNASLGFGQIYNFISPNQGGGIAYLWDTNGPGGTWKMYDAWTGQYILSLTGVPSGTLVEDNDWGGPGDILIYTVNAATGTLSCWNSSRTLLPTTPASLNPILGYLPASLVALLQQNPYTWRPENYMGQTLNATGVTTMNIAAFAPYIMNFDTNGTEWTVPIPDFAKLNATGTPTIQQIGYDNTIWLMSGKGALGAVFSMSPYETWASYSMTNGALLSAPVNIDLTTKLPANGTAYDGVDSPRIISSDGTLAVYNKETLSFYAWNVKTGQFAWGPTTPYTNGWALYNWEDDFVVNNLMYNWGFDGVLHAFNMTNGDNVWNFNAGIAGSLNPYGVNALYQGILVADGKIFALTGDHGNGVQPLYQGEMLYAIDATTGASLWNMTGWFDQPAIADGVMLTQNLYDNQIYAFGQGPSATTVTTSPEVGGVITIQGTVTDQSPGAIGTPAIADQYMSTWMAYLYEQQALPSNFPCDKAGVQVTFTAFDPNHNTITIGSAISDSNGHYALEWTPPSGTPGLYTITATFNGTDSYYGSVAQTSISTAPAATSTPAPTATPTSVANLYFVPSVVAIIIVILVVGAVLALLTLRKKP
jgi:hypothetical protein